MPTYEYMCSSGHTYEKREGFDAPARQKCPTCRKPASRVLFAPPVLFKGSGFYATDSRKSADSSSSESTPAKAAPSENGDGHSHGPGGYDHAAPDADAAAAS